MKLQDVEEDVLNEQKQQQAATESKPDESNAAEDEVTIEPACPSEEEEDEDDIIEEDLIKIKKLNEKVAKSFKRTSDDDKNACARCGLIYVVRKPRKDKQQGSKVYLLLSF